MGPSKSVFVILMVVLLLLGSYQYVRETVESHLNLFQSVFSSSPDSPSSIADFQYRTAFHFQPPKNWINDPNGPMYYNGFYHLFYQYNPHGAVWSQDVVWGHSVSSDLVNWSPLDPALSRTDPFDINGCWSGSVTILPGNRPVILYTGIDENNRQVQNVAYPKNLSDVLLREWIKPNYNPVIGPPEGVAATYFRDPSTGWLGVDGQWRVAVGSMVNDTKTGTVLLYKSSDFVHWVETQEPLHYVEHIGMLECPDFFPVATEGTEGLDTSEKGEHVKHVLKVSVYDMTIDQYTIGRYLLEKDVFAPSSGSDEGLSGLRIDYGRLYASKSFFDEKWKRRILWGWSDELDGIPDNMLKGWAGIQTVPRAIWLDESGEQLKQWPIKELESLRRKEISMQEVELKAGTTFEIKRLNASQADVEVDFDVPSLEEAETFDPSLFADSQKLCSQKTASVPGGVGPFGFLVLASEHLEEYTAVFFRIFKAQGKYVTLMCSDQSRSSLRPEVSKVTYGGFVNVDIQKTRKISLRTLIDHSVVESFGAEGRTCITSRVYPTTLLTGHAHLYMFNNGTDTIRVSKLHASEMAKARIN